MNKKVIFMLGILAVGGLTYIGVKSNIGNEIIKKISPNSQLNEKNIILNATSEIDSLFDNSDEVELEERSDLIIIGKVKEIDGAINYNEALKQYIMTSTIGTIKVRNIIKGNDVVSKNEEINFIRIGGVISVAEYEKSLEERQIVRQGFDKMTKKEKENSYVSAFVSNDIEIEKNKTYLIYMKYDKDQNKYNIIGLQYGLKEYNESTKQVKNNNSNKWETIKYEIK